MDDLIIINPKELILAKDESGKFLVSQAAEAELVKLCEAKKLIDALIEQVKLQMGIAMEGENLKKVEGERVKIMKRFYGERYVIVDEEEALKSGFAKKETKIRADAEAIDKYEEETGQIPTCVALKPRTESVSIDYADS